MFARDFPSIEAVPDATFGEFQEVNLQQPQTSSAQRNFPANTFQADTSFKNFPSEVPSRNFPVTPQPPSRNFPTSPQPQRNFPNSPQPPQRNFPTSPQPPQRNFPTSPQPPQRNFPTPVDDFPRRQESPRNIPRRPEAPRNFPTTPQPPSRNFAQSPQPPTRNFAQSPQPPPSRNFQATPRPPTRNFQPTPATPSPVRPVTLQPSNLGNFGPTSADGLNIILTSKERQDILDKLIGRDINSIVLTPLQRLAILQENQARQSGSGSRRQPPSRQRQPDPVGTTFRPKQQPTPRPEQSFRSTFRPDNFQTSFRPDANFGQQGNGLVSTTAVPQPPPKTTPRPSLDFQRNFVRPQISNNIDVNYDYDDSSEDNDLTSKAMIEQTFSLFENFALRKNNPDAKPLNFKRPSLRFLPEETAPSPTRPPPPPPTRRPPPPPPTRPPTTPPPPPTPTTPSPAPQRQRVSRVRIKVPSNRDRSFPNRERSQPLASRDRFPVPARLNNFVESTTKPPLQPQLQRTTTTQPGFPAIPSSQFLSPNPPQSQAPSRFNVPNTRDQVNHNFDLSLNHLN